MQTDSNVNFNSSYTKNIHLPLEQIEKFCPKWQVSELALFGSVLREYFRADSDIEGVSQECIR